MLKIKTFTCNPFEEITIVLSDETKEGVIIDPGCWVEEEFSRVTGYISEEGIKIKKILLTHGHFDHVFGARALATRYKVPIYLNKADQVILDHDSQIARSFGINTDVVLFDYENIKGGDTVKFGNTVLQVIAAPGHTPGGVCYYSEKDKVLISGDTLFAGTIGRTDSEWGDYDKLIVVIMDTLMGLPGDTEVVPGHGARTTISWERTHNPFLQPFNEPEPPEGDDTDGLDIDGGI